MSTTSDSELFQYWLAQMDDALNAFVASAPDSVRPQLDGASTSLDALEAWLLTQFGSVADAKASSAANLVDGAAR
jgi:hypothetical protein